MAFTKHISATQSQINSGQKVAGQLIFTSDSQRMYWDMDNNTRVEITDIIELTDETVRIALASPIEKFYFVKSTGVLWRYHNNSWSIIGGASVETSILSGTQPTGQNENDTWLELLV